MYVCTTVFFPHSTFGSVLEPLSETQLGTVWASVAAIIFLGSHDENMGLDLSPSVSEWLRQNAWFLSFTLFSFTDYGFELGQCIKNKQNWV